MEICLRNAAKGEFNRLPELARYLREALEFKVMQHAAREIASERNKRLAVAFGLQSVHQITPVHRYQYPSYDVVTMDQFNAYMEGDRTDNVFGIGKWVKSDLAA